MLVTTKADAEDVNVSMPFLICWNTSHAISCVITRDEYTYKPEPVVTAISRNKSLAKYVAVLQAYELAYTAST